MKRPAIEALVSPRRLASVPTDAELTRAVDSMLRDVHAARLERDAAVRGTATPPTAPRPCKFLEFDDLLAECDVLHSRHMKLVRERDALNRERDSAIERSGIAARRRNDVGDE